MIVATVTLVDGTRVRIDATAARRYNERVCPALDRGRAIRHLARLAAVEGRFAPTPPDWAPQLDNGRAVRWVTLGPDILLVIAEEGNDTAITALARGGITPPMAHRRKWLRQRRRALARNPEKYGSNTSAADRARRRDLRGPRIDDFDEAA